MRRPVYSSLELTDAAPFISVGFFDTIVLTKSQKFKKQSILDDKTT